MSKNNYSLLSAEDISPFSIINPQGDSVFLLTADHAGRNIPKKLNQLNLPDSEINRHIGVDIGIAEVTRLLSNQLNAWAILQNYSRLVIDCNRSPDVPTSIVEISDGTVIPANQALTMEQKNARINEIFNPYHQEIIQQLDLREQLNKPTIFITMHSFTPVMQGFERPWHIGVLYQRDTRFAHALLNILNNEKDLVVGDNQPYFVSDATDYAIPVYAEKRNLLHVEIEIRQDLIEDRHGQECWATRLFNYFTKLQAEFIPESIEMA